MYTTKNYSNFLFIFAILIVFNVARAQAPSWEWAKNSIGSDFGGARCIATDTDGNTYSAGYFTTPTLTFYNLSISNLSTVSNDSDSYIAKHNVSGQIVWLINVGGINEEQIFDIKTDSNNNIYVTGDFDSPTLTFGSTTLVNSGNQDVFLAKFDSNGTPLWAKSITGTQYDYGYALTVDSSNNVYVGGIFYSDTINISGITLTNVEATSPSIDHDVFFAKFDSAGNILWARSGGGTGYDELTSMTTDGNGNLYVAGNFYSPAIAFGSTILNNTNNYGDIFIAKYNSVGNALWSRKAGGTNYDTVRSIKADSVGNLYITGFFESPTLTFGSTTLTNAGSTNVFLTKYNTSGIVLWAKQAGNAQTNISHSLTITADNHIFITGAFTSSITFGNLPSHTTQGSNDIFVCKYDNNGQALWSKTTGGTGFEMAMGISCSQNNELSITGYTNSVSTAFDSTTINTSGGSHFVAKMPGTALGVENFNNTTFSIFPNPVKNTLFISKKGSFVKEDYIITDINGRIILKGNVTNSDSIDTSSLKRGFYYISFSKSCTTKFIKE